MYYSCARYATDVLFHQLPRLGGTMQEAKRNYNGKDHLHGVKTGLSVIPFETLLAAVLHIPACM